MLTAGKAFCRHRYGRSVTVRSEKKTINMTLNLSKQNKKKQFVAHGDCPSTSNCQTKFSAM